jgi:hypothetical protein
MTKYITIREIGQQNKIVENKEKIGFLLRFLTAIRKLKLIKA